MAGRTLNRLLSTLVVATVGVSALAGAIVLTRPAAAQWGFDDRFGFPGGDFWRRRPQPTQPVDSSRAPAAARKPDPAAVTTTVVVIGDSMADWLAHGLEQAFTDTPEVAVLRKHRTHSGLIRETRGDPPDWPVLAREILAAEKPAFVVMMVGLNDRQSIRERAQPARGAAQPGAAAAPAAGTPAQPPAAGTPPAASATPGQPNPAAPPQAAPAPATTPAPAARATDATHEFRSEKWVELYTKRIDDTIAAMKSKGVPVIWVGLPAVRRENAATDNIFLNELYKARVEKAGATFVDIWDGFVDESGRYAQQGPDFEGQTRRLRSGDGIHFTQAGARKLAHYVEREIRRVLTTRAAPIAIPATPTPEETPAPSAARPGSPVARPLSGTAVPLTTPTQGTESTLLGGGPPPRQSETPATKVIVRGEPIAAPAGRSDDFAWPRRGVAPPGTDPVATTTTNPIPVVQPPPPPVAAAAPITPGARPGATADAPPPGRRPPPRPQRRNPNFDFFGFWR